MTNKSLLVLETLTVTDSTFAKTLCAVENGGAPVKPSGLDTCPPEFTVSIADELCEKFDHTPIT